MYVERRHEDDPEYKFAFGRGDLYRIYKGLVSVKRYSEFKHPVAGFAPEDKVWVRPLPDHVVECDPAERYLTVDIDDGGDIYFNVNQGAGSGETSRQFNTFDVEELCDRPTQFLARGIRQIRIDSLYAISEHMYEFHNAELLGMHLDYLLDR